MATQTFVDQQQPALDEEGLRDFPSRVAVWRRAPLLVVVRLRPPPPRV
ncbi:hypothetical protein [Streptomyces tibetensis]